MRAKGTLIQGALAVVGLGAAYATWQREPEKAAGDVVVLEATKADIARVRFEDDKGFIELRRGEKSDSDEPTAWLKISAREERGQKAPEREVRGNESSVRLLDSLAPLKASRALGAVTEVAKLREYGLAPQEAPAAADGGAPAAVVPPFKKRTLIVTVKSDARTFSIGSPPGMTATYLKDERDGRVYLLSGSLTRRPRERHHAHGRPHVARLQGRRLRRPHRRVERQEARAGGDRGDAERTEARLRQDPRQARPRPPRTGTTSCSAPSPARCWARARSRRTASRRWRSRWPTPRRARTRASSRSARSPSPRRPRLRRHRRPRSRPPRPIRTHTRRPRRPRRPAPTTEYWARSEHTAGWVKLGFGADDLLKEAEKIAAAE